MKGEFPDNISNSEAPSANIAHATVSTSFQAQGGGARSGGWGEREGEVSERQLFF